MKNKRFLRITLIFMTVMLSAYILSMSTNAEIYEGECGSSLSWTFNTETGVLEIKGAGRLYDYSNTKAPWASYGPQVKELVIPDLEKIDPVAFVTLKNCEKITLTNRTVYPYSFDFHYVEGNCLIGKDTNKLILGFNTSVIPSNVTEISDYAFYGRTLAKLTIPSNVKYIGNYAFTMCDLLDEISLPDGLISIGKYAFSGCTKLRELDIPDSVCLISEEAFSACGVTTLDLPAGISYIPAYCFSSCWELTDITIPSNVKFIDEYAFENCIALKNVTMSDGLTTLGNSVFYWCLSLESVKLSSNLTFIPADCFSQCISLKNITIPHKVTSIEKDAFKDCQSLKKLHIPDSVTNLHADALYGCWSIEDLYISKNVSHLDPDFFRKLACFPTISPNNKNYYTKDNCIIEKDTKTLVYAVEGCIIPDDGSVTSIGKYAFIRYKGEVVLPNTVTELKERAFTFSPVEKVTLSSGIKIIPNETFYSTEKLTEVIVFEGITEIGESAFEYSAIKSIRLPSTLEKLGERAFAESKLENINFPEKLTVIPTSAFLWCLQLETIVIPSSIETIEETAFASSEIKLLVFPKVKTIHASAFASCIVSQIILPPDLDVTLYPETIRELSRTGVGTLFISSEEIAKDPGKFALFNCGAVDNIALIKDHAVTEPWCKYYDKADETVSYDGKEYILYKLNDNSRGGYVFEDGTGHWVSNTVKEEHLYRNCPSRCSSCNYINDSGLHSETSRFEKDDEKHWRICSYCPEGLNIWSVEEHNWDKGKITREPTVEVVGKIWHKCVDCGLNKIFDIPQLTPEPTVEPTIEPTPTPIPTPTPEEPTDTDVPATPEVTPTDPPAPTSPAQTEVPTDKVVTQNNIIKILLIGSSIVLIAIAVILMVPVIRNKRKK